MRKEQVITGASIGFLISIPWVAISYAGQQISKLPLMPIDLFEWLTRALPGGVVTAGLEVMIQALQTLQIGALSSTGKSMEFAMAYILVVVALTILGVIYALTINNLHVYWYVRGFMAGTILGLLAIPVAAWGGWGGATPTTGALWLLAMSLIWGFVLAWGVDTNLRLLAEEGDIGRRRTLIQILVGALALSGLSVLLPGWLTTSPSQKARAIEVEVGTPEPTTPPPTPPPTEVGFTPVPGTRPEITPIKDFYRVDINLIPPGQEEFQRETDSLAQRLRAQGETEISKENYLLVIDGLVEKSLALDINALKAFPAVDQYATLKCISNPIGGDLISTTLFQGARLKDVLDRAGLMSEAIDIKFSCIDGYTESLPIQSATDPRTLLCYAMGNQPLASEHGAPLRLYTPNRFGMKNPKWIIKIEAISQDYFGYWEQRGWSEQAFVKTASVIDTVKTLSNGNVEAGGVAFAGARGIQKVELQIDDGSWFPVELNRALSPLTWVLWRASFQMPPGQHQLTVRATDGSGELQTPEREGTYPNGATGYHNLSVNIK
ncbi:MAG TPA: molybdopterin-dependent oxidoreductase [Anaerolineales bacterium]|nr:molybdopterin-dependent oxidoreductase [Anaerolineales bacterium]